MEWNKENHEFSDKNIQQLIRKTFRFTSPNPISLLSKINIYKSWDVSQFGVDSGQSAFHKINTYTMYSILFNILYLVCIRLCTSQPDPNQWWNLPKRNGWRLLFATPDLYYFAGHTMWTNLTNGPPNMLIWHVCPQNCNNRRDFANLHNGRRLVPLVNNN